MKKIQTSFVLILGMFFLVSTARAEAPTTNELLGAVVSLDMEPAIGIPLAGYGAKERRLNHLDWDNTHPHSFFFKPSNGQHTAIRSKVMLLKKRNRHLVFVSLDTIGVEKRFVRDLARALAPLGVKESELVISGTHTHSGPGTLSRTFPLQLIATDLFKVRNYNFILQKVQQSIHVALTQLQPVELFTTSFEAKDIQVNKFRKKDQEHYDKKAAFLLARSKADSQWLGGIVNFAIHGGGMPIEILHYSSDFPGQVEMNVEELLRAQNREGAPLPSILFMNGAEGDVATPGRGVELIEDLGVEFGRQAQTALQPENLKPVEPNFAVQRKQVWLGIPASPLKYCVGGWLSSSPIPLRFPLAGFITQRAYLSLIQVGHITMMTYPGEPSTQLGLDLKKEAKKRGHDEPWVLGLTNDYMAYFTTRGEYNEGAYDSCSSLFNWRGGKRVHNAYAKMLKQTKRITRVRP